MVCVYCSSSTSVINSRHQKRSNKIWRRRKCGKCGNIFTTFEAIDFEGAILVQKESRHDLEPFSKDKLLVSIYESCRHRPTAAVDAADLTQTVIDKVLPMVTSGIIERGALVETAISTLQNFDAAAATVYKAYHPPPTKSR